MSLSAIRAYCKAIANRHRRGLAAERSYYGDLETLMRAMLPGVEITVEPRGLPDFIPDFVLTRKRIPLGYIEAKDVDKSLDDSAYQKQFSRYLQSLELNLHQLFAVSIPSRRRGGGGGGSRHRRVARRQD